MYFAHHSHKRTSHAERDRDRVPCVTCRLSAWRIGFVGLLPQAARVLNERIRTALVPQGCAVTMASRKLWCAIVANFGSDA